MANTVLVTSGCSVRITLSRRTDNTKKSKSDSLILVPCFIKGVRGRGGISGEHLAP